MTPAEIRAIVDAAEPTEEQEDLAFFCDSKYAAYRLGRDDTKKLIASRLEAARHVEAEQGEITEEWLRSIGFTFRPGYVTVIKYDPLSLDSGDLFELGWLHLTSYQGEFETKLDGHVIPIKTRADVLNLLRALGIEANRT